MRDIRELRIACLGECMLDMSSGREVGYRLSHGGDTLKTAVHPARLGARLDHATALGDDTLSARMLAALTPGNWGVVRERVKKAGPLAVPCFLDPGACTEPMRFEANELCHRKVLLRPSTATGEKA